MKNTPNIQEIARTVRKTWGVLNPVTKRIESKKNYNRKPKYKKDYDS